MASIDHDEESFLQQEFYRDTFLMFLTLPAFLDHNQER